MFKEFLFGCYFGDDNNERKMGLTDYSYKILT